MCAADLIRERSVTRPTTITTASTTSAAAFAGSSTWGALKAPRMPLRALCAFLLAGSVAGLPGKPPGQAAAVEDTIVSKAGGDIVMTLSEVGGLQRFGHKCDEDQGISTVVVAAAAPPQVRAVTSFLQVEDASDSSSSGSSAAAPSSPGDAPPALAADGKNASFTGDPAAAAELLESGRTSGTLPATEEPANEEKGLPLVDTERSPSAAPAEAMQELPLSDVALPVDGAAAAPLVLRDSRDLEGNSVAEFVEEEEPAAQGGGLLARHQIARALVLGVSVFVVFLGALMAAVAMRAAVSSMSASSGGSAATPPAPASACAESAATSDEGGAVADASAASSAAVASTDGALASTGESSAGNGTLRGYVEAMPVCGAQELDRILPGRGAYDCALVLPGSSRAPLRLCGRVEAAANGTVLTAPFTRQACVHFSAAMSRQAHDGIPLAPLAFASSAVDFVLSVGGSPPISVSVPADEVALFGICAGRFLERRPLAGSPEHFQHFAHQHRVTMPGADPTSGSAFRRASTTGDLEFLECALLVGSIVTVVGEVHQNAQGRLSLRPALEEDDGSRAAAAAVPPPPPASSTASTAADSGNGDADENDASPATTVCSPSRQTDGGGDAQALPQPLPSALDRIVISDDPALLVPQMA
eukprot:TRINITY_DN15398_c0_g1_i1.p2 TRINITY_DN15398_c0_g1~~TRINITY_DN15398_c0_g1_i1.p2  ORF type:complete len:646 (+),score=158.09 TRINITY_DN15398_c0_g1_i1:90-2027(+)